MSQDFLDKQYWVLGSGHTEQKSMIKIDFARFNKRWFLLFRFIVTSNLFCSFPYTVFPEVLSIII